MSVQDLPPELDGTTAEPEDLTVRRLVRAIDYAEGFWLGLAKSNTPAQRRRLAALCRDILEPLKIRVLEIELSEPVTDLLPVLRERLEQEHAAGGYEAPPAGATTRGERPKLAIFVHGLEHSIPSREAYPPLLSSLNLKRELFRQEVPHPLLLWLPDYALTALARKAPDFWAWRSGLYEFAPEREAATQSLETVNSEALHITTSLSKQAKRERLLMLKGLLDDYRELGDSPHEQAARASILNEIGLVHRTLGEWTEAGQAYEESLKILRELEHDGDQAVVLHNLARIAYMRGESEEARRLSSESLEIAKRLGNNSVVAGTLHNLALLAQNQGEGKEAGRLYDQSLELAKRLGDQSLVAGNLHQLAVLAQAEGQKEEARRLYDQSLEIRKGLGDQEGIAVALYQLGNLAVDKGDKAEASRLLHNALSIFERLGSPNGVLTRQSLARIEANEEVSD